MLGFYDCPSVSTWSYSGGYGQNASIANCKTRRVSWAPCFVPHNATYDIRHAYGSRTRRNHGGIDLTCVCSIVDRYHVIYSYHLVLILWPYGNHKMVTGSVK